VKQLRSASIASMEVASTPCEAVEQCINCFYGNGKHTISIASMEVASIPCEAVEQCINCFYGNDGEGLALKQKESGKKLEQHTSCQALYERLIGII
jgi:hypothetical protein